MVQIGKSEFDEPREVIFTDVHFNTYDLEAELLEACYESCLLEIPEVKLPWLPQAVLQPAYPYLPDERRQMRKKLGKPSLALSPPW